MRSPSPLPAAASASRRRRVAIAAVAVGVRAGGVGVSAAAPTKAPVRANDTGPELRVPAAELASSLRCTGDLRGAKTPVLLIHGTTSNATANWSWNWDRALDAQRWAHCDVELPNSGNDDIQVAAEYVVSAIRSMYTAAGNRPIDIVGHSQGGMIGRWALKYWPDTRTKVDDYVGLAASNHGTIVFTAQCDAVDQPCTAARWQQSHNSNFMKALNSGPETWPSVDYTEIYTRYDETVLPNFDDSGTSSLPPGPNVSNIAVQDLCPTETVEHLGMAYDNAAYLLGMDALTHDGPAVLGRVDASTCGRPFMPYVDPVAFPGNVAAALAATASSTASATKLPAEPALACYVTDTCRRRG